MSKYKFNKEQLSFIEEKKNFTQKVTTLFRYLLVSILLALLYYAVFALLFNTGAEERLSRENEMLNAEYHRSLEKLELLDNVIGDLEIKDREIYMNIFKSAPPEILYEYNSTLYSKIDTATDISLVGYAADRLDHSLLLANEQRKKIEQIFTLLNSYEEITSLPSLIPVDRFNVSQTGAGMGLKIHPFYKTKENHLGIDLLAGLGTDVFSAADGVVNEVIRSDRGRGNQIRVDHLGGYQTYYAHLGEIMVRRGQNVTRGSVIARVGNSGLSFAPHLHYEVLFNGKQVDPVNYFLSELSPAKYREMVISALNTGQSLD